MPPFYLYLAAQDENPFNAARMSAAGGFQLSGETIPRSERGRIFPEDSGCVCNFGLIMIGYD